MMRLDSDDMFGILLVTLLTQGCCNLLYMVSCIAGRNLEGHLSVGVLADHARSSREVVCQLVIEHNYKWLRL